jgi:hypothetical protein
VYAERFVRTIRQEYLDRMIFFGEASLRRAVEALVDHYNRERDHQAFGNTIIQPEISEFPIEGTICCRQRLDRIVAILLPTTRIYNMKVSFWTLRGCDTCHRLDHPKTASCPAFCA